VPLGQQHRLLAVDVEVRLAARREHDLLLRERLLGQQREQPRAIAHEPPSRNSTSCAEYLSCSSSVCRRASSRSPNTSASSDRSWLICPSRCVTSLASSS